MEKSQKRLILFMPSMDGGGVEKNIIIISNYLSNHIKNIELITFNKKFNKKIKILNSNAPVNKKFSKYYKYFICLIMLGKEIFKNKNTAVFAFQANIYCIILSTILNFDIAVRSNSSPSGWTNNIIKNFIFKIFFKIPEAIIVNSYQFKKEIDSKFNIKSKMIYNPLNKKEILKKGKKKININFFKSKKNLKIISVGRFTEQKDQITLLKAFKEINLIIDAKLLLVGYSPNKTLIYNYIKKFNLTKKVKLINYQDNPYKFIDKSDIFVLTSEYEGLPNVLLEALTLKKFIISSDCPTGPREILGNGKHGFLFKIKNYNQLADKILLYSKNRNYYKKKILSGYKSLKRFNYEINCKKYFKIINNLL